MVFRGERDLALVCFLSRNQDLVHDKAETFNNTQKKSQACLCCGQMSGLGHWT